MPTERSVQSDGSATKSFSKAPRIQSSRATPSGKNTSSKQSRVIQIGGRRSSRLISRGLTGKSGSLRWAHPGNIRGHCILLGNFCITIQARSRSSLTIPFRTRHLTTFVRDFIVIDSLRSSRERGGNATQLANGCLLCRRTTQSSVACSKRWIGWTERWIVTNSINPESFRDQLTELMRRPVRVIGGEVLRRISEPSSPLHSDYLAYRNQEISWNELIARLPHVALIGDSVCTGVYISSIWGTFWRARTCRSNNWFLDTNPAPAGIQSVSKRLEKFTPFVAIECAGIGALVDHEGQRQNFFRRILRTRNFSGQIGDLLAMKRFPDLILISSDTTTLIGRGDALARNLSSRRIVCYNSAGVSPG